MSRATPTPNPTKKLNRLIDTSRIHTPYVGNQAYRRILPYLGFDKSLTEVYCGERLRPEIHATSVVSAD